MTGLLPVTIFNLVMIKVSTPEGNIHRDLIRPCDLSLDQDHSCELTHFSQKIQLQGPKFGPCDFSGTNSSWFELKGLIPGTCPMKSCFSPHVYCSCDLYLRPNKKNQPIKNQIRLSPRQVPVRVNMYLFLRLATC